MSEKSNSDLNELPYLITGCNLSNNKVYTGRVDCSSTNILLPKIKSKFITSAMLTVMISSAKS